MIDYPPLGDLALPISPAMIKHLESIRDSRVLAHTADEYERHNEYLREAVFHSAGVSYARQAAEEAGAQTEVLERPKRRTIQPDDLDLSGFTKRKQPSPYETPIYIVSFRSYGVPQTGLTPCWRMCKWLESLTPLEEQDLPSFTDIGSGLYFFSWNPRTDGEIVGQIDGGNAIGDPNERYVDVSCRYSDLNYVCRIDKAEPEPPASDDAEAPQLISLTDILTELLDDPEIQKRIRRIMAISHNVG